MPPSPTPPPAAADRRHEILAEIPARYSPLRHIALTVGSGLAVLVVAVLMVDDLRAIELLVVPAMFVLSNFGEHFAHRRLLHRRVRPFTILYDQHTPRHHVVYTAERMAVRAYRELRLVLIPGFGVAVITVATAPFAAAAALLFSANAGWLVLTSTALYVVSYELTHLAYHLPEDHPVSRLRVVRFLREHHRRHHDPRLMQRWNFNVTVPLADIVLGTRISDAAWAETTGASPAAASAASAGSVSRPA